MAKKKTGGGSTRIERTELVEPRKQSAPATETLEQKEERTKEENALFGIMEEDVALGLVQEVPITEVDWDGGKDRDEINLNLIRAKISSSEALRQILLSIIDHHDYRLKLPNRHKNKLKDLRTFRLEQAMKYLVAYAPPRGPGSRIFAQDLRHIAKLYFDSYFRVPGCYDNLREILVAVRWPDGPPEEFDHKQIDNSINALKKAFERNRHALLTELTSPGLPEFDGPRRLAGEVIRTLGVLGLSSTPTKKKRAQ